MPTRKSTGHDEHSSGQPDAVTAETVSSVGPRVPGLGDSYAPRPSLSADKKSLAVESAPPVRMCVLIVDRTTKVRELNSLKQVKMGETFAGRETISPRLR